MADKLWKSGVALLCTPRERPHPITFRPAVKQYITLAQHQSGQEDLTPGVSVWAY